MDEPQIQIDETELFRVRHVPSPDGGRPKTWLPPTGNRKARLMLILSHPNYNDLDNHRILSGEYQSEVAAACAAAGIDMGDIYVTTMVKYGIGKKPKPTAEQIAECAPYLQYEINMVKPDLIMKIGRAHV